MSLTDEQLNLMNFDPSQFLDNEHKSLLNGHSELNSSPTTNNFSNQQTSTTNGHQPNSTIDVKPNEFTPKLANINLGSSTVEDDDFIPPEPPARKDYGKKALVRFFFRDEPKIRRTFFVSCFQGARCSKLSSTQIYGTLFSFCD